MRRLHVSEDSRIDRDCDGAAGKACYTSKSGDTEFNLIDTKLDESNAETLRPSKPISARKTKAVTIGANMQI